MMIIAVASGKGGTGKTTIATNLAVVAARQGTSVAYADCDVEEPNGALFLKPLIEKSSSATVGIPQIDKARCTLCGRCGEICQYNAIAVLKEDVMVFPEICHSCGGCWLVCPEDAITEQPREVGQIDLGHAGKVAFVQGTMNIGEAKSPALIKQVKEVAPEVELLILDCPPGTSCPVIESLRDVDYALLVTEPTPFGLNDLKLAVETVRLLGLPFGVLINRSNVGDDETSIYCRREEIEILAEISDDRRVAEAYSRGIMACDLLPEYEKAFGNLLTRIQDALSHPQATLKGNRYR